MIRDFEVEQPFAYNLIKNAIKNNSISHAYLINSNGYSYAYDFAISMVKSFICQNHYDESNCNDCVLCKRISDGNYPELKIINADGMWIKKNQILDLQDDFSKVAIEGSKRIYIIKDADKMNQQTSNSILKFLEEPSNDIIAILMTDNLNKILPTIVSRCQIVSLKNKFNYKEKALENFAYLSSSSESDLETFLSNENNIEIFNSTLNFIKYFEKNGVDSITYCKEIWHSKFKSRNDIIMALDLVINFYYDVLLYKFCNKIDFFNDYSDLILEIVNLNDVSCILNKLSVCINSRDKLKFNVNLNLFYDKFIIELGGN